MVKLIISGAMTDKIKKFYDSVNDEKVKLTFIEKKGIKMYYNCETELAPDAAAKYVKGLLQKTPEGAAMYFSVQPDGYFG